MDYQHTIKNEVSISGVGLHTGNKVTLTFKPAPINHGILFKRIDQNHPIKACASYVIVPKEVLPLKGDVKVQTPEHVLAACAGLKIDNILIEINAEEIPILDGSSIEFIKCLKKLNFKNKMHTKVFYY